MKTRLIHALKILLVAAPLWAAFYALASLDLYLVVKRYAVVSFLEHYRETWITVAFWTLLTPSVLALRALRPLRGADLGRAFTDHALCSVVLGASSFAIATAAVLWRSELPLSSFFHVVAADVTLRSLLHVANYWLIHGIAYLYEVYSSYRFGERRAAALRHQLAAAQLTALRARLNPHFLFNTFNAISSLIAAGRHAEATDTIAAVGALLRQALAGDPAAEVRLEEELELADRYLALEQRRFPDRIRYSRSADPTVLDRPVPSWILQPLFENAVKHGVATMSAPCRIEFAAEAVPQGTAIRLCNDTAPALASTSTATSLGVGLETTRERLRHLYGDAAQFSAARTTDGRFRITLLLPRSRLHR